MGDRYFFLLFSMLYCFSICCSYEYDSYNMEGIARLTDITKKKYCGDNLSKTLSIVCGGDYNTLYKQADVYTNTWNRSRRSVDKVTYPFKSKESATSMIMSTRRRKKRGVFNECCEKPCSKEELSTYCAKPYRVDFYSEYTCSENASGNCGDQLM